MEIYFATSNDGKFGEAAKMLGGAGVELRRFPFAHREVRSDDLAEIAGEAALAAYARLGKPVFTEDSGLFINALDGFPGTYSGWVQKKIGNAGILRLLAGSGDRTAEFRAAIAYTEDGKSARTFSGSCRGAIAPAPAGESGFGYDPIFVPAGHPQTFAQNKQLKNKLSHRYQSLLEFTKYLQGRQKKS
jgi:XTP/dITP diphosphohydrolase